MLDQYPEDIVKNLILQLPRVMSVAESSDEKRRKAEKPVISIKAAVELVEKYWGYTQPSFTQVR